MVGCDAEIYEAGTFRSPWTPRSCEAPRHCVFFRKVHASVPFTIHIEVRLALWQILRSKGQEDGRSSGEEFLLRTSMHQHAPAWEQHIDVLEPLPTTAASAMCVRNWFLYIYGLRQGSRACTRHRANFYTRAYLAIVSVGPWCSTIFSRVSTS
jgi:hypothetical protein